MPYRLLASFWPHAVEHAVDILNRETGPTGSNQSSFELLELKKPKVLSPSSPSAAAPSPRHTKTPIGVGGRDAADEGGHRPKKRKHDRTPYSATHASLAARKGFSHASSRHPSACHSYLALSPSILPERRATRSLGHSMPRDYPASSSSVRRKSLLVTLLTQRRDEC